MIIGIENDRHPVENDWKLYSDYRSHIWGINNWTFASKPGHPFLRAIVERVAKNLLALAERKGKGLGEMELAYKEVIDATGPMAFTTAFLEWRSRETENGINYNGLTMLEQPVLVGDVLLLPIRAMSMMEANRADGEGARALAYGEPVVGLFPL